MKPVGTSVHESGGNLSSAFAAKGEAVPGESFQAALAQALLGASRAAPVIQPVTGPQPILPDLPIPVEGQTSAEASAPIFEPRATAVGALVQPQTPVPAPMPVPIPVPANALAVDRSSALPAPASSAAIPPAPYFEARPVAPSPASAFVSRPIATHVPAVPAPAPRLGETARIPRPISNGTDASEPEAASSIPPAPGAETAALPIATALVAGAAPAAPAGPVVSEPVASEPVPKKKPKDGIETSGPSLELPNHGADPVQVPLPPHQQMTLPSHIATIVVPVLESEERREQAGTPRTHSPAKSRIPSPAAASTAGGVRPPALDALGSPEAREPRRHADQAGSRFTPARGIESEAAPAEHAHLTAKVTVEEVHVESTVGAPPPVSKDQAAKPVEVRKGEIETTPLAGRGGAPAQGQPIPPEGSTPAAEAPAQARHFEEAPRPAVPTDRVTLQLPDEAGGGRIQIAVRGDVVHARIVSADEAGTREMQVGLDELRSALSRQGFQEAHVRVDSGQAVAEGWMPAAAAKQSAGAGDSRPQDSQTQDRKERHQDPTEDSRPDPRRQQPDGRSQQRSRRERER